jgi:hypothetical protein
MLCGRSKKHSRLPVSQFGVVIDGFLNGLRGFQLVPLCLPTCRAHAQTMFATEIQLAASFGLASLEAS